MNKLINECNELMLLISDPENKNKLLSINNQAAISTHIIKLRENKTEIERKIIVRKNVFIIIKKIDNRDVYITVYFYNYCATVPFELDTLYIVEELNNIHYYVFTALAMIKDQLEKEQRLTIASTAV